MARPSIDKLEARIGYQFRNQDLLIEALTHSSYVKEFASNGRDNELAEFLGDSVLDFVVTVRLIETFPEYDEGKLSLARSSLVAASFLAKAAADLELGDYLLLGPAEEKNGGRKKSGILADALEALLAAVYRDGGMEAAQGFVGRVILPSNLAECIHELFSQNYKGILQEHLQAEHQPAARYRVVEETGLEHQKTFTVEVKAGDSIVARGCGGTKKAAEQQAARLALRHLGKKVEADG
jgi:ribonuclease III